MPIYTYKCKTCGKKEEKFISHKNIDEPIHCKCNGFPEMIKVVSLTSPIIGTKRKKGELDK